MEAVNTYCVSNQSLGLSAVEVFLFTWLYRAVIPEVLSSFTTFMAEFVGQAGHKALEMGILQSPPHFLISVAVKRIQVHPQ